MQLEVRVGCELLVANVAAENGDSRAGLVRAVDPFRVVAVPVHHDNERK